MGFRKRRSGFDTHESDREAEFEELEEKEEQFQ